MDFLLLTETWLSDKHDRWKDCTILNRDGLSFSMSNRADRKGGGLALITSTKYKTKMVSKGTTPTFEHTTWELRIKNTILTVHGVYHPPHHLRIRPPIVCSLRISQSLFHQPCWSTRIIYTLVTSTYM